MATDLELCAEQWQLDSRLTNILKTKGFTEFFTTQKQVIPLLLSQNSSPCIFPQDICVSAPTGSGKTLSYALPILNTLLGSSQSFAINRRLRALILLPSRELAQQVYSVFNELVVNCDIKVALTTGARVLSKEQELITGISSRKTHRADADGLQLGFSTIDVMISTPGRLLDHIHFTSGFTLQHLRFLVLDEADRLLGNAYHNWVRTLMNSTNQVCIEQSITTPIDLQEIISRGEGSAKRQRLDISRKAFKMPLQRLLFSATLSEEPAALALMGVQNPIFIRAKGSLVAIEDGEGQREGEDGAKVEEWEDSYQIPSTLAERQVQVDMKTRLLVLLNILLSSFRISVCNEMGYGEEDVPFSEHRGLCSDTGSIVLIFVNSVETSHRLTSFLQVVNGQFDLSSSKKVSAVTALHAAMCTGSQELLFRGRVEEMSRLVNAEDREAVVRDASDGKISIIVSSDRMARGIDLAGVKLVINFDCPSNIKTYIHRAGRTARANRFGVCLTFLKKGQSSQFKQMRQEISTNKADDERTIFPVRNLKVDTELNEYLTKSYHEAVKVDPSSLSRIV